MMNRESSRQFLNPVHQQPTDLVLTVIKGGPLLPATILQTATIAHGDWVITFEVIGESHRVVIERAGQVMMQEVLACIVLPPDLDAHHHRFDTLEPYTYQDGPHYATRLSFLRSPQLLGSPRLSMTFPQIYGKYPVTQLDWHLRDGVLDWASLHIYPQLRGTIGVYSLSTFHLTESEGK
ncbi:MAG: DUF2617 family protein [Chloroflexi bacterium]|nr:DUF2617 family protein [Chloroflexota bacterium]